MTAPPRAHTRAFLFADLRGYSAFSERHGDAAAAHLLGRYRRLVREQVAALGGAEIRTAGDSFCLAGGNRLAELEPAGGSAGPT